MSLMGIIIRVNSKKKTLETLKSFWVYSLQTIKKNRHLAF